MRKLLASLVLATALAAAPAVAEELFGDARQEVLDLPNIRIDTKEAAAFSVSVSPWHKAPGTTREEQVERALDNPPPGQRFTPKGEVKPTPVGKRMAVTLSIAMKGTAGPRLGILFLCDYKGKKEYYRELVFSGDPADFIAVGKKPTPRLALDHAIKLCKESPKKAERAAVLARITAAPGEGDGMKRLAHLVYSWKAGIGGGGFYQITTRTYALFDDGWALRKISVPLPDLKVDASRRYEPKRWTRWRKADGGFELLTERKGKESWRKISGDARVIEPAERGRRYDGRYEYWHTGGSIIGGASVSNGAYTLRKDGSYAASSFRMSESIGSLGNSAHSVRTTGKDGCSSATSFSGDVVGGTSKTDPACGNGKAGTYEIDGFVITLHANNGITSRFGFYPTGDNSFVIHGRNHTLKSE